MGAFRVVEGISWAEFAARLPPAFSEGGRLRRRGTVTALVFRTDRKRLVRRRHVERGLLALEHIEGAVAAVGGSFSESALALLREHGFEVLSLSDFISDEHRHDLVRRRPNVLDYGVRRDPPVLSDETADDVEAQGSRVGSTGARGPLPSKR